MFKDYEKFGSLKPKHFCFCSANEIMFALPNWKTSVTDARRDRSQLRQLPPIYPVDAMLCDCGLCDRMKLNYSIGTIHNVEAQVRVSIKRKATNNIY